MQRNELGDGRQFSGFLALGADAAGAEVHLGGLTVDNDDSLLNIGQRPLVGAPLGMAYIMPELGRLAANITLQFFFPFDFAQGRPFSANLAQSLTRWLDLGKMLDINTITATENWQGR